MIARVEAAAAPHRRLVDELERGSSESLLGVAEQIVGPCSPERALRLTAGVVAIHSGLAGRAVTVHEAVTWFLGGEVSPRWLGVQPVARWSAEPDDHLTALLPYVLDPFGLTTRRALLAGRACVQERGLRKQLGTFYTPGDVARSLVVATVTAETRRVLDPACGAGVFLRAAFTELCRRLPPARAVACLHGIDVDPAAVDACALVLTHDWLLREPVGPHESPNSRFASIRSRLICADALDVFASSPQTELFAPARETAGVPLPGTFDVVLMNPPFAPTGETAARTRQAYASLRAAANPAGVNLFWPFWELAARATSRRGQAGIVLPLGAAYLDNDVARAVRSDVFSRGSWALWFFDRTPDALFGDDIKQRIALAIKRPGPEGLARTTALRRWSADRRAEALQLAPKEGVMAATRGEILLKIGSALEGEALDQLRSSGGALGNAAARSRLALPQDLIRSNRAVAVAPTAYNWIGAFRATDVAAEARQHANGKLGELTFRSRLLADAAYCVVASRVFLWWWRATGDLFHVPLTTLTTAPFPLAGCSEAHLAQLSDAGQDCWRAALSNPTVAVNRGTTTTAYAPPADSPALDAADLAVADAFGLAPEFVRFVRDDATRLRIAGRSN